MLPALFRNARPKTALHWFEPVATTTGFFRALASTLTDLRMNTIDTQRLGDAGPAGADLALLVAAYERYLSEAGLADSADIYRTAASVALSSEYRYKGFPLLLLDLAPRTELERAFIAALAEASGPALAVCSPRDEKIAAFLSQALSSPSRADRRCRLNGA